MLRGLKRAASGEEHITDQLVRLGFLGPRCSHYGMPSIPLEGLKSVGPLLAKKRAQCTFAGTARGNHALGTESCECLGQVVVLIEVALQKVEPDANRSDRVEPAGRVAVPPLGSRALDRILVPNQRKLWVESDSAEACMPGKNQGGDSWLVHLASRVRQ